MSRSIIVTNGRMTAYQGNNIIGFALKSQWKHDSIWTVSREIDYTVGLYESSVKTVGTKKEAYNLLREIIRKKIREAKICKRKSETTA